MALSSIEAQPSSSESSQSGHTNKESVEPCQGGTQQLASQEAEPVNSMDEHLEIWVKRWQFHDALTRWAVWAFNILNQPPGYLLNHIFVIELALNLNPAHPEDIFTGPVPVVHDRNQLIRCFYNHKLTKDEISWCVHARWDDDQVQVCVIYHDMILHHQGTYHPGAPELNPDGRLIHIAPKQHQAFYETLSMFYLPHMCSALQMNDPALTDQYVEIIMHRTYGLWSFSVIQTPESHRHEHAELSPPQGQGESEEVLCENADVLGDQMLRSITMPFPLGEATQFIREKLQAKFPDIFPLRKT